MTFDDLKTEILTRTRQLAICDGYHQALIAPDHASLIAAALNTNTVEWVYKNGVIDDTLLAEFSNDDLNAAGIYKENATLSNPTTDIYILGTANVTCTIDGNNKCKIVIAGTGNINLVINGNGYADIKASGNSTCKVSMNDNSSSVLMASQNTSISIAANNTSAIQTTSEDSSTIAYSGYDSSYGSLRAFGKSKATYSVSGTSQVATRVSGAAATIQTNPYLQDEAGVPLEDEAELSIDNE